MMGWLHGEKCDGAPRLDPVRPANLEDLDDADLLSGDHCEGRRYANVQLDGLDLTGITFLECELLSVALNGTQLRGARFTDGPDSAPLKFSIRRCSPSISTAANWAT